MHTFTRKQTVGSAVAFGLFLYNFILFVFSYIYITYICFKISWCFNSLIVDVRLFLLLHLTIWCEVNMLNGQWFFFCVKWFNCNWISAKRRKIRGTEDAGRLLRPLRCLSVGFLSFDVQSDSKVKPMTMTWKDWEFFRAGDKRSDSLSLRLGVNGAPLKRHHWPGLFEPLLWTFHPFRARIRQICKRYNFSSRPPSISPVLSALRSFTWK